MKSVVRASILLVMTLGAGFALAQRRPNQEPAPGPGNQRPGEREIRPRRPTNPNPPPNAVPAPQDPAAVQPPPAPSPSPPPTTVAPAPGTQTGEEPDPERPTCEKVRKNAKYNIYFDKMELEKLVQTVSDVTCKTFIIGDNVVRGKISIIGPENGKVEVNGDQFYAAFLAALDANQLTVYPHGKFLKIVDKQRAKQTTIPTVLDPEAPYTSNEQMITKIFKVRYVEVEALRNVIQQMVTQGGDTIPFQPDTIIVNDIGSNMHRLERLVKQLDARPSSDEVRVIQLQHATAQDVADKIQKLFESKARSSGGGPRASTPAVPNPSNSGESGFPPGTPGSTSGGQSSGPATLTQLIPDERTNKLIIIATPSALDRIQSLVRELDIPSTGEGRINVYYLENANAEELASTLQSLAQGTANKPRPGGGAPGVPAPNQGRRGGAAQGVVEGVNAAELFSGEVKVSADKATNSLVIMASTSDYRNVIRVVEKLDIPRRQVFIEAVIMEVNIDRSSEVGVNVHGGLGLKTAEGTAPLLVGTNYGKGLPPTLDIRNLAQFGGFLAGLQGPMIPGLDIPAFGLMLHAMQQSSDVNVLSTPHILTSDNEEAEITVGQNVPFQSGFSPGNLGSAAAGVGAAGLNPASLAGIGGLGSLFAPITRQNVELKLTVKPQINESEFIRLVINEQTEEIASQDPVLGPTTSKRSAKTTVVARNQETVVLGGIMQDRLIESASKVPILGDIPILGHLFRSETKKKVKTNLLLFLTPYIVNDASDFRRILERKMKERQEFVEQFYGQVPGYEVTVDFERKAGPYSRMAQQLEREMLKVEHGGPGAPGEKVIRPNDPSAPADTTPSSGEPILIEPPVREPPPPMDAAPPVEAAPPPPPPSEELQVQPEAGEPR